MFDEEILEELSIEIALLVFNSNINKLISKQRDIN